MAVFTSSARNLAEPKRYCPSSFFLLGLNYLRGSIISGLNYFGAQLFWGSIILGLNYVGAQLFAGLNYFWGSTISEPFEDPLDFKSSIEAEVSLGL